MSRRNNKFYRLLKLDKETRQLISWFVKIKQKMLNEADKKRRTNDNSNS